MNIAIIEDEEAHRRLLAAYLEAWKNEKNINVSINYYPSAESFLFQWEDNRDFDILFVDIQMKEMNGMEMAKKIREKDKNISIVFTTGISDYLEEGYEVEAMHYLIKPINEEKVRKCMDKVFDKCKVTKYIIVHTKDEVVKLEEDKIAYIEARGHGTIVEILPDNGTNESDISVHLEVIESMSQLEGVLDNNRFIKCHRSYICNIENVHHIGKTDVYFDNGSSVPVSRRMYDKVNRKFISYYREKDGK